MRTMLSTKDVTAIIETFFASQDSEIRFMAYHVDEEGRFSGVVVDHDSSVEIPETEME